MVKNRTLGRSGLKGSEIGFGAWAIGGSWGNQKEEVYLAAQDSFFRDFHFRA